MRKGDMPLKYRGPKRRGRPAAWPVILGLPLLPFLQALGQVPPRGQRVPRYDASAVVKLVVVRVVDESGRAVLGLGKEDFTLTDNGEPKTITEFEIHTLRESDGTLARPEAGAPPSSRITDTGRKIFIFLDLQGNDENGNANAKTAALHFVDTQLRPEDEVGVLGFSSMGGFFIQVYLTSDIGTIRKAIKGAREVTPSRGEVVAVGPEDQAGASTGQRSGASGGSAASMNTQGQARTLGRMPDRGGSFAEARSMLFVPGTSLFARSDFVERMSDLAKALKYIPGSKSLVLFSGRAVGPAASLGKAFADAGTPVYAVNTQNWIVRGVFTPVKEPYIWRDHPLKDLSLASGGDYFADIKDVQTISRSVQELTGNYYVLGYYVKENWDGAYHRIRVELKKPGCRVLTQDGYFNPKPFAEMSPFEKDLQVLDLLYSEKPTSAPGPELPVTSLEASLPAGPEEMMLVGLAVDPKTGVRPAEVEVMALVRDENLAPVVSLRWRVDLAPYNGKTVILCVRSPGEPGSYDGRIAVRDLATGWSAVGRIRFAVKAPTTGDIRLSSPLLLVPGPEAKIGRLPAPGGGRGAARERPFLEIYPFIPRGHSLVMGSLDSGTRELLAVLPIKVREARSSHPPRVDIGARLLLRPDGEETLLDVEMLDVKTSTDGRQFLVVRIHLREIPPGTYELEIEAVDAASGASDSVRTPLVVK
jgi:VWFA-related protein